jgi:hypothetical protein
MCVELGYAGKIIEVVGKESGGVRDIPKGETVGFHETGSS